MRIQIRQKQGYTARDGRSFPFGTIADLEERLAVKLIRYGIAAPAPEPVETAVKAPKENAAKRVSKPAPSRPAAKEEVADEDRKKE